MGNWILMCPLGKTYVAECKLRIEGDKRILECGRFLRYDEPSPNPTLPKRIEIVHHPSGEVSVVEVYHEKEEFEPKSFRTIVPKEKHYIVIGCPKGYWDEEKQKCLTSTKIQHLEHPVECMHKVLEKAKEHGIEVKHVYVK